ncbi:MAG: hypothetical protein GKR89_00110 [Candidatus Latescibacteria bacterium]|nr:hypothetical protein [Candidatus Latescibacterota bacterium]
MDNPRLIYYNDAHHFNAKRIEPPASIHMLQWPVDEVAGTGVDLLVFGLGYADVYFHDSKVGRVVGQMKEVWESYIDWRIMRMVEAARELGTDQLREVIGRGHELGLPVFPSLKLQCSASPGDERCGLLKWNRGAEVCIGEEGRAQWCYDYANEEVQQDKLAVAREVLEDYQADGLELDFMFDAYYFKGAEIEKNIPIMNCFIGRMRELADEIGQRQGRVIKLMARVELERQDNLAQGLDVENWLHQGGIDWVVGQDGKVLTETEEQGGWLPAAAQAAGGAAYFRPPRRVYDDRVALPSIEMYRALGQTLAHQGWAGVYHGYLPWPLAEREYQILREGAFPQVHARRDKIYLLQPREGQEGAPTTTPHRQVPAPLVEGETLDLGLWVADEVEGAHADGETRPPILTIRFAFFCIEDEIEIRFNGRLLTWEEAEISDERALTIQVKLAGAMAVQAPLGMSAHWFRYRLGVDEVVQGLNSVQVSTKKLDSRAGFARSVNGVEIRMRYRDFVRPEGLDEGRIAPLSA